MFDNILTVCRAAACLTFADGRNRYVYVFGGKHIIATTRPQREHVEIRQSGEIPNLMTGTKVRPCPKLHPAVIFGIVYNDADGRWARDMWCDEYLVFERGTAVDGLFAAASAVPGLWQGRSVNWRQVDLHAGFVVRAVASYVVGAEIITLLEDADGDEFIVAMSAAQMANGEVVCLINA